MSDAEALVGDRRSGSFYEPAGDRAGSCYRDLLSDERSCGELEAVCRARDPQAGKPSDERAQQRVFGQGFVDCDGIGVEVAQVPASCNRRRQVAQVVESEQRARTYPSSGVRETTPSPFGMLNVLV